MISQQSLFMGQVPRHRTRGGLLIPQNVSWGNWNSSHVPVDVFNSSTVYCGKTEEMQDVVTPNFDELSQNGLIINNPMFYRSTEVGGTTVGPEFTTVSGGKTYHLDYNLNWMQAMGLGFPSTIQLSLGGAEDLLIEVETAARANIIKPDFQGLVSLGELGESLRYLANPLKGAMRLASNFQKKKRVYEKVLNKHLKSQGIAARAWTEEFTFDFRKNGSYSAALSRTLGDLESLYLEIRLGFAPMVYDISKIADSLLQGVRNKRQTARAKGKRSETQTFSSTFMANSITYNYTDKTDRDLIIRSMFLYEMVLEMNGLTRSGVSWSEVPSAAWELIPLSFLVDRFINVGSFISALTPKSGVDILASCTTIEQVQRITRTYGSASFSTWSQARAPSGSTFSECRTKYRRPYVDPPAVTWRTDNVRAMGHNVMQLLDIFALVSQRLR